MSKSIPVDEQDTPSPVKEEEEDKTFTFEVGCDHNPEFKSQYEIIYKANLCYTDEFGQGHSYTSKITGGAAGDGHNNIVTSSAEMTMQAMRIANKMNGKKMEKTVNSLQKDFSALNQKP